MAIRDTMSQCDFQPTGKTRDTAFEVKCDNCGTSLFVSSLPVRAACVARYGLRPAEVAALFPDEDPTLLGNRIKAMTAAIGIPTCGGCEKRRQWLNAAHAWWRKQSGIS